MNPEIPQMPIPNQPLPVPPIAPPSYLDQIAAGPMKKPTLFSNKIAILGIVAVIVIIISITISALPKNISPMSRLAAKMLATKAMIADSSTKIKGSQLRTYNSNLNLYLTNTIRDITPILAKNKVVIAKLDKSATAAESTTETMTRLEDARLNAVYDRTYAREMAYQLSTMIALMKQISGSTGDKDMQTFLLTAMTNLEPTQAQFSDYNAANS